MATRHLCVAVVLAACVFITGSCVEEAEDGLEKQIFDSIAPLLSDSDGHGDLGESVEEDPSDGQETIVEKLGAINKLLRKAKPQEASAVLQKHFTKGLWKQWGKHVKAKELDTDTAEGILNSYLCSKLKNPKMLVSVINWVRGNKHLINSAEDSEGDRDGEKETAAQQAAGQVQQAKKDDERKEKAEQLETAAKEAKKDAKADKENHKTMGKDVKQENKEKKEMEEEKKHAEKEARKVEEEEKQALKGEEEKQKVDEAKAVEAEKHQKKEDDLKVKIEEEKQKVEEEKDKAKESAKVVAKQAQEKADAQVKKAETKTEQVQKEKEELEKKLEKMQMKSEEKVKQAEEKAAQKIQAATKKAAKKAQENVKAAVKKAEEVKKEAEEEKKTAEKKVQAAQGKVVAEKKAAEKKKQKAVAKQKAIDTAAETAAIKKTEARMAAAEKAAVEKADEQEEGPDAGEVQKLEKEEEESEEKTEAIAKMLQQAHGKVTDADEILQHATKMNKFVRKSDQLLHIAKANEKAIQQEAKKLEKATIAKAAELKKTQIKRARAKLAEFKLILSNAVKDAKSVVSKAEQKLTKQQDDLSATSTDLKQVQEQLSKKDEVRKAVAAKLAEFKTANHRTAADLARANAGLKLAQQSEISEAMSIAGDRLAKIKAVNTQEVKQIQELEAESQKHEAEVAELEKSSKAKSDLQKSQIQAVDHMKNVELPELSKKTKARIKNIEASMGKKITSILEILSKAKSQAPPKVVEMVKAESKEGGGANAQIKIKALTAQVTDLKRSRKEILADIVGPADTAAGFAKKTDEDVKSANAIEAQTDRAAGAVQKLKAQKAGIEGQKKQLQEDITKASPGSAQEVAILKQIKQTDKKLQELTAAEANLQQVAGKDAAKLAADASQVEDEETRNLAIQSTVLEAAAQGAAKKIEADKQAIKAANAEKAKDASKAEGIQAKILETKTLIDAAGSGEHSKAALAKLEGYQRDFDAIKKAETDLASNIAGANADIAQQSAIVKGKAKEEITLQQQTNSNLGKLAAEVKKGEAEHAEFADSGALAQAEAAAETEKRLRQKAENDASAKVAEAQKEVTDLKAKLSAASAAAVAVAEDTKAFISKHGTSVPTSTGEAEQAAVQDAEQKSTKLKALAQKAASMISESEAEGDLEKVEQYKKDQAKIEQAIQQVDHTKAKNQAKLSQMQGADVALANEQREFANFQSGVLEKWSKVHDLAYRGAKDHLKKMQSVQDQAKAEVKNEASIVLSKSEQIRKLKSALDLALNPDQQQEVEKEESKADQLKKELARSEGKLNEDLKRQDELSNLLSKAAADNDQHSEITYGAEQQDLDVKVKRSKLHVEALKLALDKAISDEAAQPAPTDALSTREEELKQKLISEKEKLKQAQELDEAEQKLEVEKEKLQSQVKKPHQKTTEESKADVVEREAQKVVKSGEQTSKKVSEHATKKEDVADDKVNVADKPAPGLQNDAKDKVPAQAL